MTPEYTIVQIFHQIGVVGLPPAQEMGEAHLPFIDAIMDVVVPKTVTRK